MQISGPDLAQLVQARLPGLKILFISGYPREAVLDNGRLNGRIHHLAKPSAKDEFARKIREVLDEGKQPWPSGACDHCPISQSRSRLKRPNSRSFTRGSIPR